MPKLCEISVQICNLKNWTLSHLNGFHVFPHDNIRITFTVMHCPVFEHSDYTLICILGSLHNFVYRWQTIQV